jgi:sortase A
MKRLINKILLLSIFLFTFFIEVNVFAYTKDDIIALESTMKYCSKETESEAKDFLNSYIKLIKSRDIDEDGLNQIYDNMQKAINLLKEKNICSIDDKNKLSQSEKDTLYDLYSKCNSIIKSSPKINEEAFNETNDDINIVYDKNKNSILIYDGDVLSDVISTKSELNYVGMNKNLIVIIYSLIVLIILSLVKIIIKKDKVSISIFISSILILTGSLVLSDKISMVMDLIPNKYKDINKDTVVKDNQIISYPSIGNSYGTIHIKDDKENIYYGDNINILGKGIGQKSTSGMPGEEKTTILSGHNTGIFKNLLDIKTNDKVTIKTNYGMFIYKVIKTKTVDKTDITSINEKYDLIMYTCAKHNLVYNNKRVVVYLKLIDSKWGDNNE